MSRTRFAPNRSIAFQKARHEEFLCHRRELDAAVLVVGDELCGFVGVHYTKDGAGLRCIVREAEIVRGGEFLADRQAHEGVAVGGREIDFSLEHFLDDEADVLGCHRGAAGEHGLDAGLHERHPLGEILEEARRREHALDVAVPDDRGGLIDDVLLIFAGHRELAHADESFHPARVEVDEITRAAALSGTRRSHPPRPLR